MHRFSWINEWTDRADVHGNAGGIDLIVPDWFYRAVLDDALVLTIDRKYFALTGGLERWLYRVVRKHAGRQQHGWRFEFRHLYAKSARLSPFKRFAFDCGTLCTDSPFQGTGCASRAMAAEGSCWLLHLPIFPPRLVTTCETPRAIGNC
jgi:plasmid replication initiation protein